MREWVIAVCKKVLVAALCLGAVMWLALWYFIPAPPSTITIATSPGGIAEYIAKSYQEKFARHDVTVELRPTETPQERLRLVNDRRSGVDATILLGGTSNSRQSPELLSLGRVSYNPVWMFYRGQETLDRITQLKGKRIAGNFTAGSVPNMILHAHGINSDNAVLLQLSQRTETVAVQALKDGEFDVIIDLGAADTPAIQSLLHDPNVRLMNLSQAEALTRLLPFLTRIVLPQGGVDLEKNVPANDVNLVATTSVVVVRKELHPELIYLLAQTMAEVHSAAGPFHRAGEFPTQTDPEFPIAEEARDFYKNGPSFWQRYLPFRMINFTKRMLAVLVTVIAIGIPLMNYAPKLYRWFLEAYMGKLYVRLRAIETELETELTAPRLVALQIDLDSIRQAINFLPLRHSDLFLSVKGHIDRARHNIASRHVE
jgi:TRAP-type uncharacterized transport system substrate-binding protein